MVGLLVAAGSCRCEALKGADWAESLGEVVRLRRFWVLVVVSISINVCWHFLMNWLPTYLKEDRGMTYLASGMLERVAVPGGRRGEPGRRRAVSRVLAGRGLTPRRPGCGSWRSARS